MQTCNVTVIHVYRLLEVDTDDDPWIICGGDQGDRRGKSAHYDCVECRECASVT